MTARLFGLSISLMLAGFTCFASESVVAVELPDIAGSYRGEVLSGQKMAAATTTFSQLDDDQLLGAYVIESKDGDLVGTLSSFVWETRYVLECKWTDKNGSGYLRMLFSANYAMFFGFWGMEEGETNGPWIGVRELEESGLTPAAREGEGG